MRTDPLRKPEAGTEPIGPVQKQKPMRWQAVYLVCKSCGKRGKGAKRLKPKALAKAVKQAAKNDASRPRVLMTKCLGMCPKSAVTLARVGAGEPWMVAVRTKNEAIAIVRHSAAPTPR